LTLETFLQQTFNKNLPLEEIIICCKVIITHIVFSSASMQRLRPWRYGGQLPGFGVPDYTEGTTVAQSK